MLRTAVTFFVMGFFVYFLGLYGLGDVSLEVAKPLLLLFIIFSLISFIAAITSGKSPDKI